MIMLPTSIRTSRQNFARPWRPVASMPTNTSRPMPIDRLRSAMRKRRRCPPGTESLTGRFSGAQRLRTIPSSLHWTHQDDSITWDIEVGRAGEYRATVFYTCPAPNVGARIRLAWGDSARPKRAVTGAFDPPLWDKSKERVAKSHYFVKDFKPLDLGRSYPGDTGGVSSLSAHRGWSGIGESTSTRLFSTGFPRRTPPTSNSRYPDSYPFWNPQFEDWSSEGSTQVHALRKN